MTIPVPSPAGYGNLYYPVQGQTQPDPFNGRFGPNPGLLAYLLATGQPQWAAPGVGIGSGGGAPGAGGSTAPAGGAGAPPPPGSGVGGQQSGYGGWQGHGNDGFGGGHSPIGVNPGGVAPPGESFGTWAGNSALSALSPVGTMIGAMLGNNTLDPAAGILSSLGNIGRGLLGGSSAANGYGGGITGAAAQGRAAAGGRGGGNGGMGSNSGGVGGNGPMGGNGGQGANAGF